MQSLRNMLFHEPGGGSKRCKGKEMHTVYAEAGFLCLGMRHFAQKTFRCNNDRAPGRSLSALIEAPTPQIMAYFSSEARLAGPATPTRMGT
jgi:hypothetical protein